jgi:hypothetical protein
MFSFPRIFYCILRVPDLLGIRGGRSSANPQNAREDTGYYNTLPYKFAQMLLLPLNGSPHETDQSLVIWWGESDCNARLAGIDSQRLAFLHSAYSRSVGIFLS